MEPSSMTYDEAEMQRSHHFMQALKELRNLRPQLYSAAEYCESSYLYSDQKQVVLENLKDYSVKALVNAVDHLGTVAYKLNDLLNQQTAEISSVELRAASLAQRMRSCQEHSDREGLKQQSLAKTMHVNHKHYVLPAGEQSPALLRETFDTNQPRPLPPTRIQTEAHPLPSPKPLVVYQDPLPSADSAGTIHPWSSLPHSIAFTHSTTMLPIQTLPENGLTENSRAAPTRSKSLLRSLLQRRKSSSSSKTTNAS
ncbi:unnamed protein product [Sphagnum tenellum]